jgi:hypothetical protein
MFLVVFPVVQLSPDSVYSCDGRIFHFQVLKKKWMTGPDKEMDADIDRTVSSLDTWLFARHLEEKKPKLKQVSCNT